MAVARSVVARKSSPPCPGAELRPARYNAAAIGAATVCLINQIRAAHHLHALRENRSLESVAGGQVRRMVQRKYFADVSPSGQTPGALISSTAYGTHAATLEIGENIGWGTGDQATPAAIVAGWMNDPPHRRLILTRSFRDIGAGMWPSTPWSGRGLLGAVYAVEFGVRG